MKEVLLLVCMMFGYQVTAQTPIIAHKSHAGNASTYLIDPGSNFGEIQIYAPAIDQEARTNNFVRWEELNDTTILKEVTDSNQRVVYVDYISKHRGLDIEFYKQQFYDQQQYIRDSIQYARYLEQMKSQKQNENPIVSFGNPNDRNTPPFLLVVALVSVVGMILYRVLFSRTAVQV